NPFLEQLDLRRGKFFAALGRRHQIVWIGCGDAFDELTARAVARLDDRMAVVQFESAFFGIEAKLGFALTGIRAVTSETIVGKQRADIAAEIDRLLRRAGFQREQGASKKRGGNS